MEAVEHKEETQEEEEEDAETPHLTHPNPPAEVADMEEETAGAPHPPEVTTDRKAPGTEASETETEEEAVADPHHPPEAEAAAGLSITRGTGEIQTTNLDHPPLSPLTRREPPSQPRSGTWLSTPRRPTTTPTQLLRTSNN